MDRFSPKSFSEFWPFYVRQHADRRNRLLHFIGTAIGLGCLAWAAVERDPLWLLGMPIAGYGLAWAGHFRIERNRPATFTYPIYSLIGDYKMFALMLMGRMDAEVEKAFAAKSGSEPR